MSSVSELHEGGHEHRDDADNAQEEHQGPEQDRQAAFEGSDHNVRTSKQP